MHNKAPRKYVHCAPPLGDAQCMKKRIDLQPQHEDVTCDTPSGTRPRSLYKSLVFTARGRQRARLIGAKAKVLGVQLDITQSCGSSRVVKGSAIASNTQKPCICNKTAHTWRGGRRRWLRWSRMPQRLQSSMPNATYSSWCSAFLQAGASADMKR